MQQRWDYFMTTTRCAESTYDLNMMCFTCFRSYIVSMGPLCQVPREKRRVSSAVKPTDPPAIGIDNSGSLEMLDGHLQALRSMPVNLSLNSSTTTEHQGSKYGASCLAGDSRDGKSNGGASVVKTESPMGVSCSGGVYQEEPREHIRMVYEQNHYDLPLAGFLKDEQRSTPDSTNEDAAEGEVRCLIAYMVRDQ